MCSCLRRRSCLPPVEGDEIAGAVRIITSWGETEEIPLRPAEEQGAAKDRGGVFREIVDRLMGIYAI